MKIKIMRLYSKISHLGVYIVDHHSTYTTYQSLRTKLIESEPYAYITLVEYP